LPQVPGFLVFRQVNVSNALIASDPLHFHPIQAVVA